MTLPSLLFALVLSLLCGVLFHALRGGTGWRFLLHIGLSVLGFALGQLVNKLLGLGLFTFGALEIGVGVAGSILFLLLGEWLIRSEAKP